MAVTPPKITIGSAAASDEGGSGASRDGGRPQREGLRVRMQPIPGVTDKRLMGRDGFYFQCPPLDEFGVDYSYSHTDYDTIKKGQFSRKGGRQLRRADFTTLVVDYGRFTVLTRPIEIEDFSRKLVRVSEDGSPFLLTIAHRLPPRGYDDWADTLAGPELQMEATLRTLRVVEKAGEGDARYLDLSFTEYREPFASRDALGEPRRGTKRFPKTVLLKRDGTATDKESAQEIGRPPINPLTLTRLAKFYYHDPSLWRHIAGHRNNKIKNWGANDQLVDYYANVKNTKSWPVKITIPEPPGSEATLTVGDAEAV